MDNNTYNIERAVLASLLNAEVGIVIDKNYFSTLFHQKIATGINRLIELNKPNDFELLRNSFVKVNKWSFEEDNMLLDIVTNITPFSTNNIINEYIDILKNGYFNRLALRIAS